ncbi:decaheme cytochrome c [Shewanella halifaxensis HAW-EB4]|uniref:Decaheme cytochrome c n=2 Tax=Shewanella halifaxensis TaxID=271098 RepID=B0TU97_SHEHH|nr:decaheme cytochrome c [Shewanella halifaxensis HAW-EB4]
MMIMTKKTSIALLIGSALFIGGCSDGKDGKDGEDGAPGGGGDPGTSGLHIDMAAEAIASINNAVYSDGIIALDFELENKQGVGLYGLSSDNQFHDFRFSLAQLQKTEGTELKQWFSLLNAATNDAGTTFEQGFESIKDCADCLVDHKDGTYTYTFNTNLTTADDAAGIVFDPALTQRIAIEMQFEYDSGHELAENAHYDWIPATNATEGVETRDLVTLQTCYSCHQPASLKAHGGRRLDMENCQSCHNGLVTDPNAVSVELGHMVHAIHMGENREGKDAEGNIIPMPYTIAGYGGDHAFDYPAFPAKPVMDCATCHVEDEELADKDLWLANANANACTGCHTDSPAEHKSDKNPELACTDCHQVDHRKFNKPYESAAAYDVKFENVKVENGAISFEAKALDSEGAIVSGLSHKVYKYTAPVVQVSWNVEQDGAIGDAAADSSPWAREIEFLRPTTTNPSPDHVLPDNGVMTVTAKDMGIPDGVSVELMPIFSICFDAQGADIDCASDTVAGSAYIKSEPHRINMPIDDKGNEMTRRAILDEAKCRDCHSAEIRHKDNGLVACEACHTSDQGLQDDTVDGVKQFRGAGFAWKVHKASGHYMNKKYGGSGTVMKTDCATCHVTDKNGNVDGIELGRASEGRTYVFPTSKTDGTPMYASADAGACMTCHWGHESDAMLSHFKSNGGYYGPVKVDAIIGTEEEACAVCHSPAKLMEVHNK